MTVFWLYLLSDPETKQPRYVGLTQNPGDRACWHRCRPRKCNNPVLAAWFAELHTRGVRPEFSELACISGDNDQTVTETARVMERHWIGHFAAIAKADLLNIDWNEYRKRRMHTDLNVRYHTRLEDHIRTETLSFT